MSLVIAGFAGIGKTILAEKYENVIDLESSPFRWDYSNVAKQDYEKMKGKPNRIPNKNFPQNYFDAIINAQKKYDIICIWLQFQHIIPFCENNNIDFLFCYPSKEAFEDYKKRYLERGNDINWINNVCNYYYRIYDKLESFKCPKIILNKNETLEDYLLTHDFKLKPKKKSYNT